MNTNEIYYTTPEEQIEKLKSQNLIISDEDEAWRSLSIFGYSNLIKSYRDPYIVISDGRKVYRSGTSFDQIRSLYLLDKNLRNAVIAMMIDLEEHIKEAAADVIAKSFGTHPDDYLKYRYYRNKRKSKRRFSLTGILETMHDTLNTDKDPIHHYQQEHGIVPPWILFKSIYFSTAVNFIDQFKAPQQNELVGKLYNLSQLNLSEEDARNLMLDTLFICLEYRNIAAHGGRIYNYSCSGRVRLLAQTDDASHGFSQLLFLLSLMRYRTPYNELFKALNHELSRHCSQFPEDTTYLGQILNVDITIAHNVWVSETSRKYHQDKHCSGSTNLKKMELSQAEAKGFIPCKRCIK